MFGDVDNLSGNHCHWQRLKRLFQEF